MAGFVADRAAETRSDMSAPGQSHRPKPKVLPTSPARWPIRWAPLLLIAGIVAAYAGTLSTPFVFDDIKGIVENPTIRRIWPLWDVLRPPSNATGAIGRPMINLSLAFNYALGGLNVRGYHVFNIAVHALVTLLLFGVVRRTLLRPSLQEKYGRSSLSLSFAVAALWGLHPLLTESVTCVIQRTESMGAFFYLLTLYAFVRSLEGAARRWQIISVAACLVGLVTKEMLATAPVIVFLYDRTFGAGSFKDAWRLRRPYYCAMASTWLLLGYVIVAGDNRGGTVGFGLGMSSWHYALTQCQAIILYLKLAFWPHPLVLDYGAEIVRGPGEVWWQGVLLLGLVAATLVALVRHPPVGFLAFAFFSILAPSSSFVPLTTQTMAEHRMYLPLAAVVILMVVAAYARWPRWTVPGALGLALLGAAGTIHRNEDYRTVIGLWQQTVANCPGNARGWMNLGISYAQAGQLTRSIEPFATAIRLKPRYPDAEYNLGNTYSNLGRFPEAAAHYQRAVEYKPDHMLAHYGLGASLSMVGRVDEALQHYEIANRLAPHRPDTLHSYASALVQVGRLEEALARYQEVLRLTPDDPALHGEIGQLLNRMGRPEAALRQVQRAVQLAPEQTSARYALALLMAKLGRYSDAADQFVRVIRAQPRFAEAYNGYGLVLLEQEKWSAAVSQFEMAVRLEPAFADARLNLDRATLLRDLRGSAQRRE